jgi:hypothetical protein
MTTAFSIGNENLPGTVVSTNGSHTSNVVNPTDLFANYFIEITDVNGAVVARCDAPVDLQYCGDDQLQATYEECEVVNL